MDEELEGELCQSGFFPSNAHEPVWEDDDDFEDDNRRYMGSDSDFSDHALGIDY
jgi:hypothetical protein